jgi:dolichol-phosphate mannosyltransferase
MRSNGKIKWNGTGGDYLVSVIAFLSNDEDILQPFFLETVSVLKSNYKNYEFILVDDGSTDSTPRIMEELLKKHECIRYIRLPRKFGTEMALSAGLEAAIGDYVVTLEPESDPPKLIPQMVEEVKKIGGIVFGVNKNRDSRLPLLYKIGKYVFHQACRLFIKSFPPKDTGYFIGMNRKSLNALIQRKDKISFFGIFSSEIGFPTKNIRYKMVFRRKKARRRTFFNAIRYMIDTFIDTSTNPLKYSGWLLFLFSILNIAYSIYSKGALQTPIMFLLVSLVLAVFAEYLAKLVEEKREKIFSSSIYDEKNSNVMIADEGGRRNIYEEPA